jgi:hypothetical protein
VLVMLRNNITWDAACPRYGQIADKWAQSDNYKAKLLELVESATCGVSPIDEGLNPETYYHDGCLFCTLLSLVSALLPFTGLTCILGRLSIYPPPARLRNS